MLKLYYVPGTCALCPHIVLRETGLAYTLDKVNRDDKKTETGDDYTAINPIFRPGIPDSFQNHSYHVRYFHITLGCYLAEYNDLADGNGYFAGDPAVRVVLHYGIENCIRNLVTDFVGMSLRYRFRGE